MAELKNIGVMVSDASGGISFGQHQQPKRLQCIKGMDAAQRE